MNMPNTESAASPYTHKVASVEKILKDLYKKEVVLEYVRDQATMPNLVFLKKQQRKVFLKLLEIDVQVYSKLVDVDHELVVSCQKTHDRLLAQLMIEDEEDVNAEGGIQVQERVAELVGLERIQLDGLMANGSILLVDTRKFVLDILSNQYAYNPEVSESVNESNMNTIRCILEDGTPANCGISMAVMERAFALAVISPNRNGFLRIPETFHFDTETMLKLNHNFDVQVVVLTTISILREIQTITDCSPLTMLHTIDEVSERIVNNLLGFKDIDMVVDVTLSAFENFFRCDESIRNATKNSFSTGFAVGSPPRVKAFKKLVKIANPANSGVYKNMFKNVPDTVTVFKSLDIPLEAGCIAPLLHTQGQLTRAILEMHEEVHSKFYFPLVCDALITLYYAFP